MRIRLPGRQRAADAGRAQERAPVTLARAQLSERTQRSGAALSPTAQPADRQVREIDRSPVAER